MPSFIRQGRQLTDQEAKTSLEIAVQRVHIEVTVQNLLRICHLFVLLRICHLFCVIYLVQLIEHPILRIPNFCLLTF